MITITDIRFDRVQKAIIADIDIISIKLDNLAQAYTDARTRLTGWTYLLSNDYSDACKMVYNRLEFFHM